MRELGDWYTRGYLPHFDEGGTEQLITYRLADALPEDVLRKLAEQSKSGSCYPTPPPVGAPLCENLDHEAPSLGAPAAGRLRDDRAARRRENIERYLDAGHGCCVLQHADCARIVIENWRRFDGERYRLLAWVVMPNHVHVLARFRNGESLGRVVQSWKSYTAKKLLTLMPVEVFRQREYRDRFIRDETHRAAAIRYIHENPVKAGLVARAGTGHGAARPPLGAPPAAGFALGEGYANARRALIAVAAAPTVCVFAGGGFRGGVCKC
jgi:putative transposase